MYLQTDYWISSILNQADPSWRIRLYSYIMSFEYEHWVDPFDNL